MKKAQLVGGGVALAAGLGAFLLVQSLVATPPPPQKVEVAVNATEVLVARTDVALGQIATESNFKWQTWPSDAATGSYITRENGTAAMRDLSGSIARAPIMAGEPITPNKLIKAGQGGVLAAILPAGMRAISTRIKEETAAGRLILPNDHVDVILVRRMRGRTGQDEPVSDVLFRNVRVLAIGQQIETKEGKRAAENAAVTATLELTPRQSELLALANSMGDINLALRSVADLNTEAAGSEELDFTKQRGSSVRVLRYGAKSRVYGVN